MSSVAFVSGGLDSLASLNKLASTTEEVIVHHSFFATKSLRSRCEAYVTSKQEEFYGDRFKWEHSGVSLLGSPTLADSRDVIWLGVVASVYQAYTDMDNAYFGFEDDSRYTSSYAGTPEALTISTLEKLLPLSHKGKLVNTDPDKVKPITMVSLVEGMSKRDEYLSLPEELKGLFWSCREPIEVGEYVASCGYCPTCTALRQANVKHPIIPLANLPTTQDIINKWMGS